MLPLGDKKPLLQDTNKTAPVTVINKNKITPTLKSTFYEDTAFTPPHVVSQHLPCLCENWSAGWRQFRSSSPFLVPPSKKTKTQLVIQQVWLSHHHCYHHVTPCDKLADSNDYNIFSLQLKEKGDKQGTVRSLKY